MDETDKPWLHIENGASIGHTEAWSWMRAVRLQLYRIQHEDNGETSILDSYMLVMALRMVLRGAEMSRRHMVSEQARAIADEGLAAFAAAVPGGKDARDIIEHFDEYTQGVGNLQQKHLQRKDRQPDEAEAERFRIEFRSEQHGNQRHPIIVIGPYSIDLVTAADAAFRLQCDIYEALHAETGDPWPRGWAYAVQTNAAH